jgi:hypothetical protein
VPEVRRCRSDLLTARSNGSVPRPLIRFMPHEGRTRPQVDFGAWPPCSKRTEEHLDVHEHVKLETV